MYGGNPAVLGKHIRLDNDLYTVVGVMPPSFLHPGLTVQTGVEVWITAGFRSAPFPNPPRREIRLLPGALARLRPGLSVAEAQQRVEAFSAALARQFPKEYPAQSRWRLRVTSLQEDLTGGVRTTLLVVFGAVVCVLLICAMSIANLAVAKAIGRQREMAVRHALGATWGELVRQFMIESVLLAAIGGGIGCALAAFSAPFLPDSCQWNYRSARFR